MIALKILFTLIIVSILIFLLIISFYPPLGKVLSKKERRNRYSHLPYFKKSFFKPFNIKIMSFYSFFSFFKKRIKSKNLFPSTPIKTLPISYKKVSEIDYTWLGHSTIMFRTKEVNILIDPVLSGYASPFYFTTKQFKYTHNYKYQDLPPIDVLILSHNHYDHLDYNAVLYYKDKVNAIITPLGLSSYLEYWGVNKNIIHEVSWNDSFTYKETTFTSIPSKHFSGRSVNDFNASLWSGWIINTEKKCLYYSSDSGYDNHFKEIAKTHDVIDFAAIECGAYDVLWPDVHMFPEETLKVAKDLNAKVFTPIHWGKFSLAFHPWNEPPNRLIDAMDQNSPPVTFPKIGQSISIDEIIKTPWWNKE